MRIQLRLKAVWISDSSDKGFRGKTGEMLLHTVVSDGQDVQMEDSRTLGLGTVEPGIMQPITDHSWLPVDDTTIYASKSDLDQPISFAMRLIERDDREWAEGLFDHLGTLAKPIIVASGGGAYTGLVDPMVVLIKDLMALDKNDPCIDTAMGLSPARAYHMGQYRLVKGVQRAGAWGSWGDHYAGLIAVMPEDGLWASLGDGFQWQETGTPQKPGAKFLLEVPGSGLLSVLVRLVDRDGHTLRNMAIGMVRVTGPDGAMRMIAVSGRAFEFDAMRLPGGGSYTFEVLSGQVEIDVMYVADDTGLADPGLMVSTLEKK